MEEDNEKEQLRKGMWSAINTYILISIILIGISLAFGGGAGILFGLGIAEAAGIIFFIPGIIVYIINRNKEPYFAKGFLIGSLIPIAIAVIAFGGCTLLFSGSML